jgi:hypothetical protein
VRPPVDESDLTPGGDLPAALALKAASVCAARNQHDECRVGGDQQQRRRTQSLMMERATSSQSMQKPATSRVTLRRAGYEGGYSLPNVGGVGQYQSCRAPLCGAAGAVTSPRGAIRG